MALKTKIIVQQILNIDDTTTTASKYPKYTVVLGNSISSITAGELTAAVEASAASAAAAKDSEVAAKLSEINARDSENKAAIYADSSEASATQSATSATEAERQAGLSKDSADASAASATEAGTYKDAAELAAQNAEKSRELAEQAKTAAQQAQVAAETAKAGAETAETNAEASATTAGEHAAAAKQSELNAKTSETNAAAHEVEAGNQAGNATTEADRAKAEADRAAQVVDGKLDKVDISGFIKVYKTKAEADADVGSRVLGEKILVWNQTDSKYGWYKVAGTVEAPVLELVETEQKLVSINNVHADDAGNVQITLPGGNPSLWLGEVTWFPYDKDSGVGYPGVLPADGREVLRVDYPDTWEAIEAGLIPSVTEEQWQAGATLYFSTGNGTTTFRLPDMMQGQAFRAAAKGEENAGNIKEQIPYITMINGKAPADDGTITLGNAADKNVWNGVDGEVLLRGAFGLGGAGLILNEPDAVSFFKAIRAFGSGYYRNDNESNLVIPKYSAGFYSKVGDTHTFICSAYSNGVAFVASASDRDLDEESTVHTNILYGTANKPDLNNDTQGVLGVEKGGTGATTVDQARGVLKVPTFMTVLEGGPEQSLVYSPDFTKALKVDNSTEWGLANVADGSPIPLSVRHGGTGATSATQARGNLGITEWGLAPTLGSGVDPGDLEANCTYCVGPGQAGIKPSDQIPGLADQWYFLTTQVHADPNYRTQTGIIFTGDINLRGSKLSRSRVPGDGWSPWKIVWSPSPEANRNYLDLGVSSAPRFRALSLGNIPNSLGDNSIAFGDNDTGIRQLADGVLEVLANSVKVLSIQYNRFDSSAIIRGNAEGTNTSFRVDVPRVGGTGSMLAGIVDGHPDWASWRDRSCGMLVETPANDKCTQVWKTVQWGREWSSSFDVYNPSSGGYSARLNIRGGSFQFGDDSTAIAAAWNATSDIRLKANLNEISDSLYKLSQIKGYTYYKRNTLDETEYSYYQIEAGIISQDVETVLPEAVTTLSNPGSEVQDYKAVNYNGVTALMVNAVNDLAKDVQAKGEVITKLENEVEELKASMAELKALVATLVNK